MCTHHCILCIHTDPLNVCTTCLHCNIILLLYLTGSSSGTVIAVVVVCLAFLIGVIALAVVRIKRVQNSKTRSPNMTVEDGPEMEWDNSTLNVTVNPFESVST